MQHCQSSTVRLADGKIISTIGKIDLSIMFGPYHYSGPFEVLDCEVPLILGMTFLAKSAPKINFSDKSVFIMHNGVNYSLPTCDITKNSPTECTLPVRKQCACNSGLVDHNSFRDLPLESTSNDASYVVDDVAVVQ